MTLLREQVLNWYLLNNYGFKKRPLKKVEEFRIFIHIIFKGFNFLFMIQIQKYLFWVNMENTCNTFELSLLNNKKCTKFKTSTKYQINHVISSQKRSFYDVFATSSSHFT